ncbi:MAG TPA: hypothetical protein VI278_01660 [Nitrososphaeraceae archaeon]
MSSKQLLTVITVFVGIILVAATITSQASAVKPLGTGPYCPSGTTYNDATGRCGGSATCPSGFRPDATGTCVAPTTSTCPPGFTLKTYVTCMAQPSLSNCPPGSMDINQRGQCTACFDRILFLNPNAGQVLKNKGDALTKLQRHADAERCYKRARGLGITT